ncbi:hypothetical protein ACFZAU_11635 [Streptomyces sp. NPDC008238]
MAIEYVEQSSPPEAIAQEIVEDLHAVLGEALGGEVKPEVAAEEVITTPVAFPVGT